MKSMLLLSCAFAGAIVLGMSASNAGVFSSASAPLSSESTAIMVAASNRGDEVAIGAEKFVNALAQEGIGFLGNKSMSPDDRKSAFRTLLGSKFDMQTIGRFALGRYWQTASPEQRKEYLKLFQHMTVEVYSQRFRDYQGQTLEVRGSRPEGAADVLVHSAILQSSGPEVKVDWRVRRKDGNYKVVDVIVEGVSMAVTQRSDFASVIQRGGGNLEVLLTHLRSKQP